MRIGFDAKRALNNPTGLGNHARILINALIRDFPDNDYMLFTPGSKDEFLNQLQGNFRLFFPESKLQKVFHPLWRSWGIKKQLHQNRADIYHGLSNELPFGIQHCSSRNIVTIHDLIFLKHKEQYPFADRQFYELKTRYAAKNADMIIAVSQETKKDLIEFYKVPENRIAVIYPSVDPIFYPPELSQTTDNEQQARPTADAKSAGRATEGPKYILNVGSFFPRKNHKRLIEAYSLIAHEIEEELWLVGNGGNMMDEVKHLVSSKKLQQRVKILADVKSEDLPTIYQQARVFVFPSLFEGFGAPVLEALFSRTPVIASGGGAIEEAAGKDAVFVNPLSLEDIAEKILKVIKSESLRKPMIEAGYVHALTMTDKVFAQKVMDIYKQV
jgi:glycosyltransferase involved in cell wall biosynthesis